jgi:REP element-mobilizing transposase RayT
MEHVMPFNPDIHHRQSIRLREYDYAGAGAYFATICTHGRECLFGEAADEVVRLNDFGGIVQEEWLRSAEIRNEIFLDEFIVMPNHIHGIIIIDHRVGADGVRPESGACAQSSASLGYPGQKTAETREHGCEGAFQQGACHAPLRVTKSLGSFIAGFKSAVTKRINQIRDNSGFPVWQRNYFERVIRNDRELDAIREYIVNNPMKWAMDRENPVNCHM